MINLEICDADFSLTEKTDNENSQFLSIVSGRLKQKVLISSIRYIESNRHKVIIHTIKDDYECYQKLNDYEKTLRNHGFLRCHKSFLVSMHHVVGFSMTHIRLTDMELPISRRYQPLFRKYFIPCDSDIPKAEQGEYGSIICTQGTYMGSIIHIYPEQKILIGRDLNVVDIQINLPLVSRIHCELIYHSESREYEVTDYSRNGVFINRYQRLVLKTPYIVPSNTEICFGDMETIYKLL